MSARETALMALIACRKEGAWSNSVLKDYIRRDRLDARDGALATRLCYGVLQNRQKLDFYLKQLFVGRLKDLHPVVRDILHMGLYQILEMDRIPESAAVNECVNLAKKYCKNPKAGSLVNGVLRSAIRRAGQLERPSSYCDLYSHPEDLINLLKQNLPKGTLEGMLKADNAAPPTVVQVNTLRASAEAVREQLESEHVTAQPHPWMPDCLVLSGTGNLERLPSFRQGLYYVQDPAAKLSVLCAGLPREGCRVLDCCAAPGGKSFASAIAMQGRGEIVACDIHQHKLALIEGGAARLGIEGITARVQDACRPVDAWRAGFDAVIADVPCSGLGIIRKKPDIRYKDLEQMEALPQLQLAILENQSTYLKPGGTLLYSTCTVLKRENEDVVRAFLNQHPEFFLESLPLPDGFPQNETGMLTLIPGQFDTDGFFIARMRKRL